MRTQHKKILKEAIISHTEQGKAADERQRLNKLDQRKLLSNDSILNHFINHFVVKNIINMKRIWYPTLTKNYNQAGAKLQNHRAILGGNTN